LIGVRGKVNAAKAASTKMLTLTTESRRKALATIAEAIWKDREQIIAANQQDLREAEILLQKKMYSEALVKRLKLDEKKLRGVVKMINSVMSRDDPLGRTEYAVELDEDMELYRISCPIGVIGVIFESRPDVLAQTAFLCLMSGNAVIMKGGSEAKKTNEALYNVIDSASIDADIPVGWIQLLDSRTEVNELLKLDDSVDLLVPRGSNSFVKYIQDNTRIAVLGHSEGVCQIYVDRSADLAKAVGICYDAKVQYPAVCNAVDTLLVHREFAENFLPMIMDRYVEAGVEVRGCSRTVELLGSSVKAATEDDWGAEYLDLIVSVKIVNNLDEAIEYVNEFGSHHTDAIIAEDSSTALRFLEEVDSANIFWNASTRFSDGYRYGLGAEVGISTGKIHARGPTGLEGLTTYKYYLVGSGNIVKDYVDAAKKFTHRNLSKSWSDVKKDL
jgi:glutamate-5-semialdehyde dehydrogenase